MSEPMDFEGTGPEGAGTEVDQANQANQANQADQESEAGFEETASEPAEDVRSDAERERDEYLDALRHLQADFENYKKRVARQFEELSAKGAALLVEQLFPVLDTLDLAEDHLLAEDGAHESLTTEGKALIQARAMLLDTLAKGGLERVGTAGDGFDPQVHDAVAHVDAEDGPVVDEVLRVGYRWRGQVLRPAMVKVRG